MKIFRLAIVILISVFLVACGAKSEAEDMQADGGVVVSQNSDDETGSVSSDSTEPVVVTLHFPYGDRQGTYEGEATEGNIPNGEGMFTSHNEDGLKWTIRGLFVNGLPEGNGICSWEDANEYRGNFTHGVMDGQGEWRYNGEVVYTGIWSEGRCVDIDRPLADVTGTTDVQAVHWGNRGFYIPRGWDCEMVDECNLKIKAQDGTIISVSKHPDDLITNVAAREREKALFEQSYIGFGTPILDYENYDGSEAYELSYKYDSEDYIFPVEIFMLAFQKGRDYYTITTFDTSSVYDYSEAARCIYDTFTAWELMKR